MSMVFFVYIVYVLLFTFPGLTPSGYYPSLKVPKISMVFFTYIVYVLLFAFPGMIPSGYYAEDFHGFLRHTVRVPVRLSRSPMLRTSALPDLQFLAFGNSQFDSLIFTLDLALLDFSMSIRSTSRIDLVVLVPDLIWFEFSVVRNVRFSFQ